MKTRSKAHGRRRRAGERAAEVARQPAPAADPVPVDRGERSVGRAGSVPRAARFHRVAASALLRRDGLVRARRDGQTIWYSIASVPARHVLETLFDIFCKPCARSATRRRKLMKRQHERELLNSQAARRCSSRKRKTSSHCDPGNDAHARCTTRCVAERIVLIDVREKPEHAAELIEGSRLHPLSTFDPSTLPTGDKAVVLHCGPASVPRTR